MSDAYLLNPGDFFDFIAQPKPAVVFLSGHNLHRLNPHLATTFAERFSSEPSLAQLNISRVNQHVVQILAFLQQEIQQNDLQNSAPFRISLPLGYFLFYQSQLIAWRFGLPASADVGSILKSTALGAACAFITRDLRFFGKALWWSSEREAAAAMARDFAQLFGEFLENPRPRYSHRSRDSFFSEADSETELERAYRILEINARASDKDVHQAWRRMQKKYHPDRAARDPETFEQLSRRCADINWARDTIRRHRGSRYRRAA